MLQFANECKFRDKEESICTKYGYFCPEHAAQDDLACGGVCYIEEDYIEEEEEEC